MQKKLLFFITLLALQPMLAIAATSETGADRYLASILEQPEKLHDFMASLPKGGDLHNHTSGSAFAEKMVEYAASDNLCVDRTTYTVTVNPLCLNNDLLNNAIKDADFYDNLVDAWSMQHFHTGKESGHDHFFNAFTKFSEITHHHTGEILAEIAERAAEQNELYVETMLTIDGSASGRLGQKLGWDDDFAVMRNRLLANNFNQITADMTTYLDTAEAKLREVLACGTANAKPGCTIQLRYQSQVPRERAPEVVFAQMLAGFEGASKDKRIVAVNMVMPEDGAISMRDYKLHMRMIHFLHELYPDVSITLHAGELNTDIAPPEGLRFHINDAVKVAGAARIGHGADLLNENNYPQLLKTMADRRVMVEINLSSNADILNMEGKNHPLPVYLQYGVPVAISTDDEGVTRDTITTEYVRAATAYRFSYSTLKNIVRNSLTYAFLPGTSLWQDVDYHQPVAACAQSLPGSQQPAAACQAFLASSEKATLQWQLEKRLTAFESQYAN